MLAGPAPAANQQDVNDCKNDDPDRSIAGCTRLLNSSNLTKRLRAQSYYNRGLAWHDKGEADRAIADFTEAIRSTRNTKRHTTTVVVSGTKSENMTVPSPILTRRLG